ncbi:hypothetical protein ACS0TY_013739 [Phlomoides rotata]
MSMATEKPCPETRSVLAPTGNRVRVLEEQREMTKEVVPVKSTAAAVVLRCSDSADSSLDSSVSSSSASNVKSAKTVGSRRFKNTNGVVKAAKIGRDGIEALPLSPAVLVPIKRCDWITPNTEPLYTYFHDEEWGVLVVDDVKLFELLVFSQALAELSWPLILSKRPIFRKLFHHFDPKSVANLDEDRLISMRVHGGTFLSEPKLRAIVHNAKQLLKVQQEFGSFNCWRFVNHKPIKSGFRYARQFAAKTPKSELISKDLMRRGFRCVGPTVVYSFMQVAGLINDHLVTCYRYNECAEKDPMTHLDKGAQLPPRDKSHS